MPARKLNENKNKQTNKYLKKNSNNSFDIRKGYLTLRELSKVYPYSQEYLSLLARHKKIRAKKIGRNWYSSRASINKYIKKQGLTMILPAPASYKGKISKPISILPEQIAPVKPKKKISVDIQKTVKGETEKIIERQKEISGKFDRKMNEEKNFFGALIDKLHNIDRKADVFVSHSQVPHEKLSRDEKEFVQTESQGSFYKFKKFNRASGKNLRGKPRNLLIMISAIVLIFLIVGGISFGNVDSLVTGVKNAFKDATTLQGHWPGTHANEVLLLNDEGNISIYGHIETKGQLRSWVKDGIAPLVVDSTTMVENLNAEMLEGTKSKEFTLAFVTKNGNLTTEDVFLEGNVEIGKTLLVKGATKLLDSLLVNGSLGVWGDIVGRGDLRISGNGSFGRAVTISENLNVGMGITTGGDINTQGNNLILGSGTISTTNTNVIANLNADMVDSMHSKDFTLDYVVRQGNETSQKIKVGGLHVTGVSNFDSMTFHNDGLWATDGSFNRSLGVGGFFSAAGPVTLGDGNEKVVVDSSNWDVDENGAMTIGDITSGAITASGNISTTGNLDVDGNAIIDGTLSAGSAALGNITGSKLYLTQTPASSSVSTFLIQSSDTDSWATGSATFLGINASSSFSGNFIDLRVDNTSKFSVDETGNLDIGGDLVVNGEIIGATISVAGGWTDDGTIVRLTTITDKVGIGTATPSTKLQVAGSGIFDSELIIGGPLQAGGTTSVSYSRFGIGATNHGLITSDDLLISSDLEVNGQAWFDANASVSGNLEVAETSILKATTISSDGTLTINAFTLGGDITGANYDLLGVDEITAASVSLDALDMGGNKIVNVLDPTDNQDAATKYYVDSFVPSSAGGWTDDGTIVRLTTITDKVGIGTTDVTQKLEVAGTASVSSDVWVGSDLTVVGTLDPADVASFTLVGTETLGSGYYINNSGDVYLRHVGIGTVPNSTYLLQTLGDVYFEEQTFLGTTSTYFDTAGNLEMGGGAISDATDEVDINDSLAVNSYLQVGGDSATNYSRFGIGVSSHGLSGASDLLISGKLEVASDSWFGSSAFFDSTVSVSGTLEMNGSMRLFGALYDVNNEVGTSGQLLSTTGTGIDWIDASGVGTDEKVKVDSGATAGYLGAAYNDGVLRIDNVGLGWADGGDFITISHKDTSAVANSDNSGNTFIQDISFDTFGHVQTIATSSVSGLDNYVSWTAKDYDGTEYTITSLDTLWFKQTSPIKVDFTADDELTFSLNYNTNDFTLDGGTSLAITSASYWDLAYDWKTTSESFYDTAYNQRGEVIAGDYLTWNGSELDVNHDFVLLAGDTMTGALILDDSNELIVGGPFQAGGLTSVSYSRFGIGTSNHGLSNPQDLLISGKLEVASDSWFGNNASVSGNLEVGGYFEGQPLDGTIGSGVISCDSITEEGNISISFSGLDVSYPNMKVRLAKTDNSITYCDVSADTITAPDNAHTVYYLDDTCVIQNTTMANYLVTDLSPGGITDLFNVATFNGSVINADGITVKNKETIKTRKNIYYTDHLKVVSGLRVNEGTFPAINSDAGKYWFIRSLIDASAQDSSTDKINLMVLTAGSWGFTQKTGLDLTACTNGTDSITCSDNKFRRYYVYLIGGKDGTDTTQLFQLPAEDNITYQHLGDCLNTVKNPITYSLPAIQETVAVPLYAYCGKRDDSSWGDGWIDLRLKTIAIGPVMPDTSVFVTVDGERAMDKLTVDTDTLYVDSTNHRVGIGTTSPTTKLQVSGAGLFDNELLVGGPFQAGGLTSVSYSRFGIGTSNHGLSNPQDLLISGKLEVASDSWFGNNVSVSNNFEVGGIIYGDGSGLTGITGADVASNSLDFDEFVDAMTLDANLVVASAGYNTT